MTAGKENMSPVQTLEAMGVSSSRPLKRMGSCWSSSAATQSSRESPRLGRSGLSKAPWFKAMARELFQALDIHDAGILGDEACGAALAMFSHLDEQPIEGLTWTCFVPRDDTGVLKPPEGEPYKNRRLMDLIKERINDGTSEASSTAATTVSFTRDEWRMLGTDGSRWQRLHNRPTQGRALANAGRDFLEKLEGGQRAFLPSQLDALGVFNFSIDTWVQVGTASGLVWTDVGTERPVAATELLNDQLSRRFGGEGRLEFTNPEWLDLCAACGIKELRMDHYVHDEKSGRFFMPAGDAVWFAPVANGLHGLSERSYVRVGGTFFRPATELEELLAPFKGQPIDFGNFFAVLRMKLQRAVRCRKARRAAQKPGGPTPLQKGSSGGGGDNGRSSVSLQPEKEHDEGGNEAIELQICEEVLRRIHTFRSAFLALDTSDDGRLSIAELEKAIAMFGVHLPSTPESDANAAIEAAIAAAGQSAGNAVVASMPVAAAATPGKSRRRLMRHSPARQRAESETIPAAAAATNDEAATPTVDASPVPAPYRDAAFRARASLEAVAAKFGEMVAWLAVRRATDFPALDGAASVARHALAAAAAFNTAAALTATPSDIAAATKAGRSYQAAVSAACPASGLKWKCVGPARPTSGSELVNTALQQALAGSVRFSPQEWTSFGVEQPLKLHHYVRAGDSHYVPAGAGDFVEQLFFEVDVDGSGVDAIAWTNQGTGGDPAVPLCCLCPALPACDPDGLCALSCRAAANRLCRVCRAPLQTPPRQLVREEAE